MRASLCGCDFKAFIKLPSFDHSVDKQLRMRVPDSTKSGAAKLFHEAVAKGATARVTSTTLWLQLKPRSDRVGTAGRSGNSVNAENDRRGVRRKLVTALAQYQGPAGFLFSGK